ncbi:radical SAM protein [Acidobacteria bacterium AH-259-O06]|nr:radical SAM protein [Acidobacteria bacterium AH-259-O06]
MRRWKRFHTTVREWKMAAKALISQDHPVLAHVIPIRRCNLSCAYCNEYDDFSDPVPTEVMFRRLDRLAELGTSILTISGGEPLMHPELEKLIVHTRRRGMLAGLITNGYLLSRKRVRALNNAGLEHLQISIDNVKPDEISFKSLKVLDKKLRHLAELADFKVNINSVLGAGVKNPEDALMIGRRAVELGFTCTVGIIHDGNGVLKPLGEREKKIFFELKNLGKKGYPRINQYFQENLVKGKQNNWRCRAGARYLYICEDGLVHYCSQQRGYPGVPLTEYTREDIRREYLTKKPCAPYCTISCVHHASIADFWRAPQELKAFAPQPGKRAVTPSSKPVPMEDLLQLE